MNSYLTVDVVGVDPDVSKVNLATILAIRRLS